MRKLKRHENDDSKDTSHDDEPAEEDIQEANTRTVRRKLPRFLGEDEVHRMFLQAEKGNSRDLKILKLLYYFGFRNDEMCSLRIENINLNDGTIKVVQGKGGKDRMIPIVEINPLPEKGNIYEDLRSWMGGRRSGLLIEGLSDDGGISDRHVRRIVKNYAVWSKIRDPDEIHPHTLRHSYATHLKNLGLPLEIIQRVLGHEKIDTTLIYAHMGVENLRSEIKKYVWIARMKKELPEMLKIIEAEKLKPHEKFMVRAMMVLIGAAPDE